jgi:sugar/nucleoside kinase (ribokinase family)
MMSNAQLDVVCLGIFVADAMAKPIERMPGWRELALLEQVELHTGGCASNTATGLARLGFRVGAMGKVGEDGFGDFVLHHLQIEGIDAGAMARDGSANTSFTFVMIAPDGERAFFHYIGANGEFTYEDVNFDTIQRARFLHIAGSLVMGKFDGEPTAEVLRRAREMNVITCLDTVWNSAIDPLPVLEPCLPHLDYFLPSVDEAALLTGLQSPADMAAFFLDRGVGTVGLKLGDEGCWIQDSQRQLRVPAFEVEAVDTSGAGDAWVAGLLAGLLKGWDLEQAGRLANAMGAMCVTAIGTTPGLRTMEDTLAFMEEQARR